MVFKVLLAIEIKKVKVKMNKPVYLALLISEISKRLIYEFWYDYIKQKYWKNAKLCYLDTDSFIIHIETEDFYEDVADDDEKRLFNTSSYEVDRPLPKLKNKVIGLMTDELEERLWRNLLLLDQNLILT